MCCVVGSWYITTILDTAKPHGQNLDFAIRTTVLKILHIQNIAILDMLYVH
jgi:hypothetical protein